MFNKVGQVLPKGSNSTYSCITENLSNAYFRLKIIDLDGSYIYSEILYINSSCYKNPYAVIPNPAENQIEIIGLVNNDWVRVSDITGRLILKYKSSQNNVFNVQGLTPGMYIMQVINNRSIKATLKFIKK